MTDPIFIGADAGARDITAFTTVRSTLHGVRIIESVHLADPYEDWSRVRSPGRARRRMRQGHRQNVVYGTRPSPTFIQTKEAIFGHPATIRAMTELVAVKIREAMDAALADAIMGGTGGVEIKAGPPLTVERIEEAVRLIEPLRTPPFDEFLNYRKMIDRHISEAFLLPFAKRR